MRRHFECINKVILPFVGAKRKELKLQSDHPALVIYDEFKSQLTDSVYDTNRIYVVKVPPNCTDRLQPMDLSVNKSAKEFLRTKFCLWYSEQVEKKLAKCDTGLVDTRMSVMKPIGASWLKSLFTYLEENQMIAKNGFKAAGCSYKLIACP